MKVNNSGNQPVNANEAANARASQAVKKGDKSDSPKRGERVSAGDTKADISAKGKEFAKTREMAGETPDVREDRIAELKQRLAEGSYRVDPHAIADRLVDEHLGEHATPRR